MNATSENFLDNLINLINSIKELEVDNVELEAENKQLKEENEELRQNLIEYGRHRPGCPHQYDTKYICKCKWNEVKQSLEKWNEKT